MLQIENELETSIESNYNQNNHDNFQNPDNIQEKMDDFEQKLEGSSSTHKIYQNASNKIQQSNEKVWTIPLILESPKNKSFQSPDLTIGVLIDSRAESNIINIPTKNERQTLHPKLIPLKTSSKLATAQGSNLTNFRKIQLFLIPTRTMEQKNF